MTTITTSTLPTPSMTMARALPHNVDEVAGMTPFDLFKSQLESNTEAKIDAMKRLKVVSLACGPQETLKTIIPYLTNNIANKQPPHEDELLLELAQQLEKMVPTVLSGDAHCITLLPILERLMGMEETVVRDAAVKTTNHILGEFTQSESLTQVLHLSKRLAGADWFTAKVSVAGILPSVLKYSSKNNMDSAVTELKYLMRDLATDDTPMVRRAAAKSAGEFLGLLKSPSDVEELLSNLNALCSDEQDSVRLLALAGLKDFGSFSDNPEWTSANLLPLLRAGSTDASWRVRHNLAKVFSEVSNNLGTGLSLEHKKIVMACFVALLQDIEPEVRAAAVSHFASMVKYGGEALFTSHLQPLLPSLADDVVMEVRSKMALALMDSAEGGTLQDATILQSFSPLLENFLQDEYPEVQLHVLQNLARISHLLTQMSGVVSSILHMSKASNWRVRQGVAQLLPHLAEARGMEFFQSVLLEPAWLTLLLDPVASVREACVYGTTKLCSVAGSEWMLNTLVPHHLRIFEQSNYLLRMTILHTYVFMAEAEDDDVVEESVNLLIKAFSDKVANVRMTAAKGLLKLLENDVVNDKSNVKAALESQLEEDNDDDCRHFCQLALEAC